MSWFVFGLTELNGMVYGCLGFNLQGNDEQVFDLDSDYIGPAVWELRM